MSKNKKIYNIGRASFLIYTKENVVIIKQNTEEKTKRKKRKLNKRKDKTKA